MIVEWKGDFVGTTGFNVSAEDYDAQPAYERCWFDAAPKRIHADREALAAFLIFGHCMGGHVTMPHKFSPALDVAMRSVAQPTPISFSPVEFYPKALPSGTHMLDVSWDSNGLGEAQDEGKTGLEPDAYLRIARSDRAAGSLRTFRGLTVASNAFMHSREEMDPILQAYPFVAAAVLFAEDLDADAIRLTGRYDTSSREWRNLAQLLSAARLGLDIA